MNKSESRRAALAALVNQLGRGAQAEIFKRTGVPASYISRALSDPASKGHATIGEKVADRISAAFPNWENLGQSYLTNKEPSKQYFVRESDSPTWYGLTDAFVPMYKAVVSMGYGSQSDEPDVVTAGLNLHTRWIARHLPGLSGSRNLAALIGKGDSMQPTYSDGDVLLIDTGVHTLKQDAVYALQFNDELYVKRIQRKPDGTVLILSDNKTYETVSLNEEEAARIQILGRVLYAWNGKKL